MLTKQRAYQIKCLCVDEARRVAKLIGASAWYDHAEKFLTKEEKKEVFDLSMDCNGTGFWMNSFLYWMDLALESKE